MSSFVSNFSAASSIPFCLPILYGIDKNGKTKVWKACVNINMEGLAESVIEYGFLGGKLQTASRIYTAGKNIGKKNETTPYTQAISETRAKWLDKQNKESYSTTAPNLMPSTENQIIPSGSLENDEVPSSLDSTTVTNQPKYFPMLAKVYEPTKPKAKANGLNFPCYIQPKLDGVRCISYMSADKSKVLMQSRTGSYFESMEHISQMLFNSTSIQDGCVLDGELYCHTMPFEELVGLVKKKKLTAEDREKVQQIQYHVYDIVCDKEHWSYDTRRITLASIVEMLYSVNPFYENILKYVETRLANNITEFKEFFSHKIQEGYEGVMLRTISGKYRCNYRSNDLLKYKEFFEGEYEIVGYKEGDGRDKGTVIWNCRTPENNVFSVRPKGSIEMRKELYTHAAEYIGKQLTVIYQELSEQGVPRFPVGKCIRSGY